MDKNNDMALADLAMKCKGLAIDRDRMNEAAAKIDSAFQKMNIGVESWTIHLPDFDRSGLVERGVYFGYGRLSSNRWGIGFQITDPRNMKPLKLPWEGAPARFRVVACHIIPELITALIEAVRIANDQVIQACAAIETAAEIISANSDK